MIESMEGHAHPITLAIARISEIFSHMGFDTVDGPELEDEWHNFDALNVPKDHPARDMQDTFWIQPQTSQTNTDLADTIQRTGKDKYGDPVGYVLRTHTSNMQIRTMEHYVAEGKAFPLPICCPGKVFRNEATDATHEAQFHQVEMLYVGKDASLAMMLGVIEKFFSEFFGSNLVVRLRSSYFPFVEPGNEVDMQCFKCKGKGLIANGDSFATSDQAKLGVGCNICKQTGWIEIGGAGMVHPHVLEAGGINPREYRGFAFGCGIDRMIMLKYGIDDVRLLYNGDLRVVSQF
jgi:phenylalanyl-tRNA synthetase alpha chain